MIAPSTTTDCTSRAVPVKDGLEFVCVPEYEPYPWRLPPWRSRSPAVACPENVPPADTTMSRRLIGSRSRLCEASIVGKPRPLLPTIAGGALTELGSDCESLGEKLRVVAPDPAGAADSAGFAFTMLVAASAMKRGVGM